jgi:hypothetical protein
MNMFSFESIIFLQNITQQDEEIEINYFFQKYSFLIFNKFFYLSMF